MSKSAIWPIIVIILIIGFGLFIWGSAKNKNQNKVSGNTNEPTVESTSSDKEEYFSDSAKVMFFYSDGCGWCQKEKSEVLSKLGKEGYRVKPINSDTDAGYQLFNKHQVTGTPTFIVPDGQRLDGFQEYDALKKFLDKYK